MKSANDFSIDTNVCMHMNEPERFLGAIVPPVFENSLFVYDTHEKLAQADVDEQHHYLYMRGTNPTVEAAERKLAALERGEQCKCFSSGMAAITAALLCSVQSGDHILGISNLYCSTVDLFQYMQKFGVQHSILYSTHIEEIERAILPNTKVIYMESPTSMLYRLVDLQAVASIAKKKGIRTIVDNTWATPLFQKPLLFGIDIVVHSASKYIGGHNDLIGGALITNRSIMRELFKSEYLLFGGVMSPHAAARLLRSLQTLPIRMKKHEESAIKLASFLQSHPAVAAVYYPGLPEHPDYELGQRQMSGYSGLFSFELKDTTFDAVCNGLNKLNVCQIGVSWGGAQSLLFSSNSGVNAWQLMKEQISPGLVRMSVGLEDAEELMKDIEQALR